MAPRLLLRYRLEPQTCLKTWKQDARLRESGRLPDCRQRLSSTGMRMAWRESTSCSERRSSADACDTVGGGGRHSRWGCCRSCSCARSPCWPSSPRRRRTRRNEPRRRGRRPVPPHRRRPRRPRRWPASMSATTPSASTATTRWASRAPPMAASSRTGLPAANHGCESCHGPGKTHVDTEGEPDTIVSLKSLSPDQASATVHHLPRSHEARALGRQPARPAQRRLPELPQRALAEGRAAAQGQERIDAVRHLPSRRSSTSSTASTTCRCARAR